LTDYHGRVEFLQFPNKVDHVGSCNLVGPRSLLQVEVYAVTSKLLRPLGDLLGHLLCGLPGGQPVPGVGLDGVRVSSDGKHYDCVSWHRPGSSRAPGSCQRPEGGRDVHRLRVDEGEEENVGGLLLPLEQLRLLLPLGVTLISLLVIVSQENVEPQHLTRPGGVGGLDPRAGLGGLGWLGGVTGVVLPIDHDTLQHRQRLGASRVGGFELDFCLPAVLPVLSYRCDPES